MAPMSTTIKSPNTEMSPVSSNGMSSPPRINTMTMSLPDQPAARMPRAREPVAAQTDDSTTRPPSSGCPGSRLNKPMSRLVQTVTLSNTMVVPLGSSRTCDNIQAIPAMARFDIGATIATVSERSDVCALPCDECWYIVAPPQEVRMISLTCQPNAMAANA